MYYEFRFPFRGLGVFNILLYTTFIITTTMKKFYFLLIAIILSTGLTSAQCIIDTTELTSPGIYPPADSLPCIVRDSSYDQTLQIRVLASFDTTFFGQPLTITVHWVHILRINGLPGGIEWSLNPSSDTINGGQTGCLALTGSTDSATGAYSLHPISDLFVHIPAIFPFYAGGDTLFTNVDISKLGAPYKLNLVSTSDSCHLGPAAGVNDMNGKLNSALDIYPNPNNGLFELSISGGQKINGEITIRDIMGRNIFTQTIDDAGFYHTSIDLRKFSKGLYTLQLQTPQGFASGKISIE